MRTEEKKNSYDRLPQYKDSLFYHYRMSEVGKNQSIHIILSHWHLQQLLRKRIQVPWIVNLEKSTRITNQEQGTFLWIKNGIYRQKQLCQCLIDVDCVRKYVQVRQASRITSITITETVAPKLTDAVNVTRATQQRAASTVMLNRLTWEYMIIFVQYVTKVLLILPGIKVISSRMEVNLSSLVIFVLELFATKNSYKNTLQIHIGVISKTFVHPHSIMIFYISNVLFRYFYHLWSSRTTKIMLGLHLE